MTYQIVRIYPMYHFSTDAHIGNGAQRLPMSYRNEALAHKLAGRLQAADYESFGDDSFVVVPYGESPFNKRFYPAPVPVAEDNIPF